MRRIVVGAVMVASLTLPGVPSGRAAVAPQFPNLVPLPPVSVGVGSTDDQEGPALRFSTAMANRGAQALDLVGIPEGAQEAIALQCVVWGGPRACAARSQVGRFVWHPDHAHFHFEDFALYELRRLQDNGLPDMTSRGVAATGGKISFCLIDVEQDRPAENPVYSVPHPLYYSCLAGSSSQGISPGWRDVYSSSLTGQQIPIDGVANGSYALVVTADPDNRLFESNDSDNVAAIRLKLTDDGVEILCAYDLALRACS